MTLHRIILFGVGLCFACSLTCSAGSPEVQAFACERSAPDELPLFAKVRLDTHQNRILVESESYHTRTEASLIAKTENASEKATSFVFLAESPSVLDPTVGSFTVFSEGSRILVYSGTGYRCHALDRAN